MAAAGLEMFADGDAVILASPAGMLRLDGGVALAVRQRILPAVENVVDRDDLVRGLDDLPVGEVNRLVDRLVEADGLIAEGLVSIDGEVLRADGPLSEHRAVPLARKVADALVATRAIGVVHRDIKPANIMVNGDDATLLDFGIALAQLDADMHLTAPATTLGTAAYMSPEQAMGLRATAASDVYALGGVLIAMLTGRPPYSGDNAIQVANRHLNDPVPRVRDLRPGVSGALADLIERMMAKDANARPDTAIVRDDPVPEGDVQITTDDDALAFKRPQRFEGAQGHVFRDARRRTRSGRRDGWSSPTRCRTRPTA